MSKGIFSYRKEWDRPLHDDLEARRGQAVQYPAPDYNASVFIEAEYRRRMHLRILRLEALVILVGAHVAWLMLWWAVG